MNIFSESNPAEEGHPAGQEGKRARRPLVRVSAGSGVMRLAVMGVVGGMLVAGLALPAVGGAGAMVVTASDQLNLRPEALEEPPLAEKTTVLDARGRQIAQFYEEYREVVPLDRVSEVMKTAIISIEDYRFYEHGPIDIEGTIRAFAKNLSSGGVAQGGSSITQQYVKQVLLNTAVTREEKEKALEASYARKLNELRYAMAVEEKYTKDEILEKYLNIAYFGAGANGIEAAAKRFFGCRPRSWTWRRRRHWPRRCSCRSTPTPRAAGRTGSGCWSGATWCWTGWRSSARSPSRRPTRPKPGSWATRAPRCPAVHGQPVSLLLHVRAQRDPA